LVNIAANKNTVPGDKSAMIPSGIRMGSPAMTTRGLGQDDFVKIAHFVDAAVQLTIKINRGVEGRRVKDFKDAVGRSGEHLADIQKLKDEVIAFSKAFPAIGFDQTSMKYN
jgi:glycine hydroxymethyltransferase